MPFVEPKIDPEVVLERLARRQGEVLDAEQALREKRSARLDDMRRLDKAGVSRYRMAQVLGISQTSVKKLLDGR